MSEGSIFSLILGAILVNNVIFARFLGTCPYLGVSKRQDTAIGMGLAVIFVMTLCGAITWPLQRYVLEPDALARGLDLSFLQTMVFILVIASLVQFVEIVLKKTAPGLYQALGIYLPLITTNCAILGIAILSVQKKLGYVEDIVYSAASAAGFALALILFAGVRERLAMRNVPRGLAGIPIGLVTAGILAMAFMGFAGLGAS
ncbi:MAG: RnfABCDGE type electron transport complex subunit A [Myxococcales bacterium]|nr:RnfABCDGE type electron transport complex subunit A [Myxococcales bacterium]